MSAGPVRQLDLRWKLAEPATALTVVVPVPTAVGLQRASAETARGAAATTAPRRRSFLIRPWVLAGDGGHGAIAARDALQAATQQVDVSASSVVRRADLAAALARTQPDMAASAAREAAQSVISHAQPGARYAVALLQATGGGQLRPGWVGTLRLTVRGDVDATLTPPDAGGAPSSVIIPLPGGVLGADGPQVVAVTADTAVRAASADNVAPLVTGVDRVADGGWQSVLYGQGHQQVTAADVIETSDAPAPYHAVEPVLLPGLSAWPWVLAAAALLALAVALVARRSRHRSRRA
ncbi:MAG: hypothetical protein ACTHLJ_13040 [Angustibacter sp.]